MCFEFCVYLLRKHIRDGEGNSSVWLIGIDLQRRWILHGAFLTLWWMCIGCTRCTRCHQRNDFLFVNVCTSHRMLNIYIVGRYEMLNSIQWNTCRTFKYKEKRPFFGETGIGLQFFKESSFSCFAYIISLNRFSISGPPKSEIRKHRRSHGSRKKNTERTVCARVWNVNKQLVKDQN